MGPESYEGATRFLDSPEITNSLSSMLLLMMLVYVRTLIKSMSAQ